MSTQLPALSYDVDKDVRALSAMASNLTPYLYEDELYGHLSGDLPRLTLGGLLLRLYRLRRVDGLLDPEQETQVQDAAINFDAARAEWSVHYKSKLAVELKSRLDALDRYLHDCGEQAQGCVAEYPVQAEKRTMIQHLYDELAQESEVPDDLEARMKQVDNRLRRMLSGDDFVFDARLKSAYPPDQYWWLYGRIGGR